MEKTADESAPAESDGWSPTEDAAPMRDEMLLSDPTVMTEVTHAMRGRLLRHLRTPRSAAELAELLDVPITRLYHHLNRLEEFELISVVETRRVGAATERRYRATASSYRIEPEELSRFDAATLGRVMGGAFDLARLEFEREIEDGELLDHLIAGAGDDFGDRVILSLASLRLTTSRQYEFVERLTDLVKEYTDDAARGDEANAAAGADEAETPSDFVAFLAAFPITLPTMPSSSQPGGSADR